MKEYKFKINGTDYNTSVEDAGEGGLITADNYEFEAKHYIGGVSDKDTLIDTMENYKKLDGLVGDKAFVNIKGGNVNKIATTSGNGFAFVRSNDSMKVNGVKSKYVNLSAGQDIEIGTAEADTILVDGETRNLTVELPSRNYTLKYTNIKDDAKITIDPIDEITYDMANGDNGWNKGVQTAHNTYLVVPGGVTPPGPTPPGPKPPVNPINPEDNDNVKILKISAFRIILVSRKREIIRQQRQL